MNVLSRVGNAWSWVVLLLALAMTTGAQAARFNLNVVDGNGNPVNGFRWLLQEDTTYSMDPTSPPPIDQQLATGFHRSYHPLARTQGGAGNPNAGEALNGNVETDGTTILRVTPGRYYVSVFPYAGHAMGGAPVTVHPNADDPDNNRDDVTVVVESHPIPTAQIAVYLFHDCYPLNGAPDLPEEQQGSSTCTPATVDFSQFNIVVEEPAGKYGVAGGPLLQDAFGNPLGTTYNPDGSVLALGDGTLAPNPDGTLLIKNLAPGKYGIIVTPPAGWTQTSTIEGSPVIDAWVKANEPPFFVEFGLPGPHVFVGFTRQRNMLSDGTSPATVSGTVTDMHMSRPPSTEFFSGRTFPQCWVAVNDGGAQPGINRYAMPCDAESGFSIANVPPGSYELKVFDRPLDIVIATMNFTVDPAGTCNGGQSCNFGNVPVFNWFSRLTTYLFSDTNQNGFWDGDEIPLGAENGPVNIRWRDGTVYQSFPTDFDGVAPFDEAFPFFHWLVAEVGFTNKKATGATIVVDAGGEIPPSSTGEFPDYGELNPQPQSENGGAPYRTEVGPVLTQAFQGFLGQTSVIQFGKAEYLNLDFSGVPMGNPPKYVGENGGISGIVFNTVTRAENDPQFAVAEEWEPGVPRVEVALYADGDIDAPVLFPFGVFPAGIGDVDWNGDGLYQADDNVIDDVNRNGRVDLADVDNHPLGNFPGPEDVNRCAIGSVDPSCDEFHPAPVGGITAINYSDGFDYGDAIAVTWTDSWDDNLPDGCQGANNVPGITDDRCFDGMRNWNQVRPGVFDGGYAFAEYDLDRVAAVNPAAAAQIQAFHNYVTVGVAGSPPVTPAIADTLQLGLLPADYIVEAAAPVGYRTLREHHKNVDFGDEYQPAPQALPAACVGPAQPVPALFAIATKDGSGDPAQIVPGIALADAAAPFAGQLRPVCDQKKVPLQAAQNAAADFFLVTDVPVAANVSGMVLNDLANEFNPNSPNFGEKFAPPLVPVAFYDWNGKLVNRVYTDEYGRYNAMVPSTWTANLPQPSGMSPNMLLACMNDAGPIANPLIGTIDPDTGLPITADDVPATVVDPFFNPAYSQFCYTFQYMPGSTTYLDTPVVAIAAYTNPVAYPVDCAVPQRTPMIHSVENTTLGTGPFAYPGHQLRIHSLGREQVPNPEWDGVDPATRFIVRNRNFGAASAGTVELEDADGNRHALTIDSWAPRNIFATVPASVPVGEYQVVVTRVAGVPVPVESEIGVTLTVAAGGTALPRVVQTSDPQGANGEGPIQVAIDEAAAGDLILVAPGEYDELVIMHKPVKLQGWGAGAVTINARQIPTEKTQVWRDKIAALIDGNPANGEISLLPGQEVDTGPFQALGAPAFPTEEGAGILVAGPAAGPDRFGRLPNRGARIDGFSIVAASQGGGIVVNGYAQFLNIGNNVLTANAGFYGGGIRVGHPALTNLDGGVLAYTDAVNDQIRIHHNHVLKNGLIGESTSAGGGGIALYTGADAYRVQDNWVCGNFSVGQGGGIAHIGLSNGGRMERNDVLFNESFSQANAVNGGGIYIGGQTPLVPTPAGLLLSDGTGNVVINANRVHGNLAGAGDGGGIAIVSANGMDVVNSQQGNSSNYNSAQWWDIGVYNNMISNNVAGVAGALTIQDALEVHVQNNTIAHNDSTATAALAFTPGFFNQSNALPAGVVSRFHTPDVTAMLELINDMSIPANGGRVTEYRTFADANLNNNIVFGNRSFYWLNFDKPETAVIETGLFPADCIAPPSCTMDPIAASNDVAVLDGAVDSGEVMFARFNLLTDNPDNVAEYSGTGQVFTVDPLFVNAVFNEGKDGLDLPEFTVLQTAGAFDEGGNFIQVAFGPLTIVELGSVPNDRVLYDYHVTAGSPAVGAGQNVALGGVLAQDFDGDPRTNGNTNEIGADELP